MSFGAPNNRQDRAIAVWELEQKMDSHFLLWPQKAAVEIQSWSIIETPGYILFLDRL